MSSTRTVDLSCKACGAAFTVPAKRYDQATCGKLDCRRKLREVGGRNLAGQFTPPEVDHWALKWEAIVRANIRGGMDRETAENRATVTMARSLNTTQHVPMVDLFNN